jgi:hypothetical protein
VAPSIRKKLAITSPTSGGRSVGIVRSRTQTLEFSFSLVFLGYYLSIPAQELKFISELELKGAVETSGYKTLRFPHFLDNPLRNGGEVVSITSRPPFTHRKIPGT